MRSWAGGHAGAHEHGMRSVQPMRWRTALAPLLALACGTAAALSPGQVDTFTGGALEGWGSGAAHPSPPVVVGGGGPGGAGDAYLSLVASGLPGPGGKLVAIAGPQWRGDYATAGITGLSMAVNNLGATDLSLRLWLLTPQGSAVSSQPVVLLAGSGWQPALFPLAPGALSWQGLAGLGEVTDLRLFHGAGASYPGQDIAAQLGIDNVAAVPEPAAVLLWSGGLAALASLSGRRRRRSAAGG